ncbi:MAG: Trk system potassium transporter TrkA [Clostridia bacterium]|jgi:trk system potassium uptake protein TrkA|nr:Trk system potassium transporter TrkA [Clostridia bacterium]MBR3487617.1 Trk system potassium transporter TrkA [Clostridia bacterium]
MNIIIAGYGKVGSALTRQLSAEGYDLTIIDSNRKKLESGQELYDVLVVHGNCATMSVLEEAGVKNADILIAATSADEINLLCCLTAHKLNKNIHTIARIRNPEYSEQIVLMRDSLGLSLLVNPEKQAAQEMERLIRYPGFMKREKFAHGRVEIAELRVTADSPLCDIPLMQMGSVTKCHSLVCTVLRNGNAIAPNGHFILKEGDRLFVTATTNELALLLKNLGIVTHRVKRVIICGGGKSAPYLAQMLEKGNIKVQIVERDQKKCLELAELLPFADIVNADASDLSLWESERLSSDDAIVAMTGLDELNMMITLYVKSCGVHQTITKLSRTESSALLDKLDLGSVICPKDLCSNTIVGYVRGMKNQTGASIAVHRIADGKSEATEFHVTKDTLYCGVPLKDLKLKKNVLIASILHLSQCVIPNGESCFYPGDTVIVVSDSDRAISRLNDIFE